MKNIVCYVRVSHEEQAKFGYSLDAQKDALQKWADDNNCKIVGWYIDSGVSARKKVKNRPALQQLLNDIQNKKKIDLIIFIKLDRYFRSVSEYHETQKILDFYGVPWRATLEDYDTTTTDGRFKVNLMLSIAEQEADRTSDRIKFTFAHKLKKKQPISGNQPFGYTIGKNPDGTKCVIMDEKNADYVREIFAHFLQYQSISGASNHIHRKYGIKIWYQSMKNLLENTMYFGEYKGISDYCPAYIDRETFDKIQKIIKTKNTRTYKTNRIYLFSGLLRCPLCNFSLAGNYITRKNGAEYFTYRCNNAHRNKMCENKYSMSETKLEQWLLSRIKPELEKYIAEIQIDAPNAAPVADSSEILAEMDRLNYMFQKNRIKIDDYEKQYSELEKRLDEIENAVPRTVDLSAVREFLNSDILDLYTTIPREDKRAAWRSIIDEIVIYKNGEHVVKFL